MAVLEALGMGLEGGVESGLATDAQRLGMAVVHAVGRHEADARVAVLGVVPGEEGLAVGAGVGEAAEARGKSGRYFKILNCASECGLSSETWGGCGSWRRREDVEDQLAALLARAAVGSEQPVHGAHQAEVAAPVGQRGMHGRGRRVGEALAVERGAGEPARARARRATGPVPGRSRPRRAPGRARARPPSGTPGLAGWKAIERLAELAADSWTGTARAARRRCCSSP
jgi:hypothetical protein